MEHDVQRQERRHGADQDQPPEEPVADEQTIHERVPAAFEDVCRRAPKSGGDSRHKAETQKHQFEDHHLFLLERRTLAAWLRKSAAALGRLELAMLVSIPLMKPTTASRACFILPTAKSVLREYIRPSART